ncbi:MAG TPA: hypothetical protein VJH92_05940 [Candidatus Nanoarchaeia archaeon]|nr:hypothetical protein [Candidatus Nanoarchaeia archaeon]
MTDNISTRTEEATACFRKANQQGGRDYLINSLTIPNTQLNDIVDDMVQHLIKKLRYKPEEMMDYKLTLTLEASERNSI